MSQQANLSAPVQRLYADLAAGSLDQLHQYVAADISWHSSPTMPWGRAVQDRIGIEGVREYLKMFAAELDASAEIAEMIQAEPDRVVVLGRIVGQAKRTRQPFECKFAHVFWVRGGLIVKHEGFPDTAAVLIAMGAMSGTPVFPKSAAGSLIQAGAVKLWHSDDGASGDPVVLLGSFTTGHAIFDFVRPLLKGFRTITWEPRGLGESDCPDPAVSPYNEQVWADDLHAFLRALRIPRAHLWATGFGNYYAVRFAAQHPDMVASFIAYTDSWAGDPTKAYDRIWNVYRVIAEQIGTTGNGARMLGNIFDVPDLPWFSSWERIQVERQLHPHTVAATVGYSMTRADVRGDLGRIKVPTMVLQGDHDWSGNRIAPGGDASLNLMQQKIPQLETAIIPDAHPALALIQQPRVCADRAMEFMRRHSV